MINSTQTTLSAPASQHRRVARRVLSLLLVALLFVASGCSKKQQPDVVEAQATAVQGASEQDASQRGGKTVDEVTAENGDHAELQGYWITDLDASFALFEDEAPELLEGFNLIAARYLVLSLHFGDDGAYEFRLSMLRDQEREAGAYKVVDAEGDTLTVDLGEYGEGGGAALKDVRQIRATFLSQDQLRFAPVPVPGETETDILVETRIFKRTTDDEIQAAMEEAMNDPTFEELFGLAPANESVNDAPDLDPAEKQPIYGYWVIDIERTIAQLPPGAIEKAVYESGIKVGLILDDQSNLVIVFVDGWLVEKNWARYGVRSVDGDLFTLAAKFGDDAAVRTTIQVFSPDLISFGPAPGQGWTEEEIRSETYLLRRVTESDFGEHLRADER